ncbi:MAG: hypothetical protein OEW37_00030 [Rhodospirillaceae bacterium]|nr:hypothetical protein [Rhodospirillaceae bacterium]
MQTFKTRAERTEYIFTSIISGAGYGPTAERVGLAPGTVRALFLGEIRRIRRYCKNKHIAYPVDLDNILTARINKPFIDEIRPLLPARARDADLIDGTKPKRVKRKETNREWAPPRLSRTDSELVKQTPPEKPVRVPEFELTTDSDWELLRRAFLVFVQRSGGLVELPINEINHAAGRVELTVDNTQGVIFLKEVDG